ncbi:MAG: PocR ligand-binding domain-containing protein, partial [Myxococcota bacterium]
MDGSLLESVDAAVLVVDSSGNIRWCNHTARRLLRLGEDHVVGKNLNELLVTPAEGVGTRGRGRMRARDGVEVAVRWSARPASLEDGAGRVLTLSECEDEACTPVPGVVSSRTGEAERPSLDALTFEDLFDLPAIQRLQDEFARATGVASIITRTDGAPITRASSFCRLCQDVIRGTEKGRQNCFRSDAELGRFRSDGPTVQPCMSGGLWDAGAAISVGGNHVANWLIGQVRDETQSEEKIAAYARE